MGELATYENERGERTSDGLSILDIVKHAVKAVIHMLTDADRLVAHQSLSSKPLICQHGIYADNSVF